MTGQTVTAERLSKVYRVYDRPWDRIRESLDGRQRHAEIAALRDVDLDLQPGESLGIIGENGAGKSTLLSILSGVVAPSSGHVQVRGRNASLLELGMGFHPELSGRQNILFNAAMMGLDQHYAEARIPAIIEFSELADFIDRPVKTYSTGMAMRLGFAIAVQVDPDVLIVDEALSVGDGYFQKKCMDRIRAFLESGRTLVFCSHALYYVASFCQKGLWLRRGKVEAYGPVDEVVKAYEHYLDAKSTPVESNQAIATGPATITRVHLASADGSDHSSIFRPHEPWALDVSFAASQKNLQLHLGVALNTATETQLFAFGTKLAGLQPLSGQHKYRLRLDLPSLPLQKGEFSLWVFLLDESGMHVYDQHHLPAVFSVANESYRLGLMDTEHSWALLEPHQ